MTYEVKVVHSVSEYIKDLEERKCPSIIDYYDIDNRDNLFKVLEDGYNKNNELYSIGYAYLLEGKWNKESLLKAISIYKKFQDNLFSNYRLYYIYNNEFIVNIEPMYQASIILKKGYEQNYPLAMYSYLCTLDKKDPKNTNLINHNIWEISKLKYAPAQNMLAITYRDGYGTKKDNNWAIKCFDWAANQGNYYAAKNLAKLYLSICDTVNANKYFAMESAILDRRIKNNDPIAMYDKGIDYQKGNGCKADLNMAMKLYIQSAKAGYIKSQLMLADYYNNIKNYKEAIIWYELASSYDNTYASYMLACYYNDGLGVEKNYNKAFECFKKSASKGHAISAYYLGNYYLRGQGVQENYSEALKYLEYAADKGIVSAIKLVGNLYLDETRKEGNYQKALKYLKASHEQGDKTAAGVIAVLYSQGLGTERDVNEALRWRFIAVNNGDNDAKMYLGDSYYYGMGTSINYPEAFKWYKSAVDSGNQKAMYSLGYCYYYGMGTSADEEVGLNYIKKAAANNHEAAIRLLKQIEE